jgi:phage shock protein A
MRAAELEAERARTRALEVALNDVKQELRRVRREVASSTGREKELERTCQKLANDRDYGKYDCKDAERARNYLRRMYECLRADRVRVSRRDRLDF